jgi:homoserine kinase type II
VRPIGKTVYVGGGPEQDRRVDDPKQPTEPVTKLLAHWGIPAGAAVALTGYGTNNHTLRVTAGARCWSLRISQNLTSAQVQAEHRLLAQLAQAGLPFAVPAPVALPDGSTVVDTPGGPATLCEWIPGVRPDLSQEAALERFGRAAAELSDALRDVAPQDTPHDWQDGPLQALSDDDGALVRDLTAAGLDDGRARVLRDGADRAVAAWDGIAGRLPTQVVHADLVASNVLVSPDTGAVTGVLDFETAGCWIRAVELAVVLALSGAVRGPGWPRRAAAVVRGGAWRERLTSAELAALPDLILVRAMGSMLWRAERWRRGQSSLAEVATRLDTLAETLRWRTTEGGELEHIVAASGRQTMRASFPTRTGHNPKNRRSPGGFR